MPQQKASRSFADDLATVQGRSFADDLKSNDPPPPPPAEPAQSSSGLRFLGNLASGMNPLNIPKGLYQLARHPYDTLIAPAVERLPTVPQALREGRFTDAANAVAGSVPIIGPASEAISAQSKSGDTAGALGQLTALMVAPKAYSAVGSGLKASARLGGRAVMDAAPAVIETALMERAMPGVFRSGAARANQRIGTVEADAQAAIGKNPSAPIDVNNMVYARGPMDTLDDLRTRMNAAPDEARARGVIANTRANPKLTQQPTAQTAFDLSRGSYRSTLGDETARGRMERAIAESGLREAGFAVPEAAHDLGRLSNLHQVAAAYAKPKPSIAPGMLPTMSARIAAAAANRAVGPTSQGMYRTGQAAQAIPPEALRAILLAELFQRSGGSE